VSQTTVEVTLLDSHGNLAAETQVTFPKTLLCNSDMAQKMDGFILESNGRYYTYHRIAGKMHCSFKEREVICV